MQQYNKTTQKAINFDDNFTKENIKEQNPNWREIPDHPYRILVTGGSYYVNKIIISSNKLPTRY